jgi:hypothetical protein
MKNVATHVDYDALEEQKLNELQKSITERLSQSKDLGHGDSLRHVVLYAVVAGNYDGAKDDLNRFVAEKREFPNFQRRVERFQRYTTDLINAIEAKRTFQGLASLPLAKQQELYEKVIEHFEELKILLNNIERMEKEAKLNDIRSTAWVLRALMHSTFLVMAFAFFLDVVKGGLAESFAVVFESFVTRVTDVFFRFIGW